jgi:hypothetical protein
VEWPQVAWQQVVLQVVSSGPALWPAQLVSWRRLSQSRPQTNHQPLLPLAALSQVVSPAEWLLAELEVSLPEESPLAAGWPPVHFQIKVPLAWPRAAQRVP